MTIPWSSVGQPASTSALSLRDLSGTTGRFALRDVTLLRSTGSIPILSGGVQLTSGWRFETWSGGALSTTLHSTVNYDGIQLSAPGWQPISTSDVAALRITYGNTSGTVTVRAHNAANTDTSGVSLPASSTFRTVTIPWASLNTTASTVSISVQATSTPAPQSLSVRDISLIRR